MLGYWNTEFYSLRNHSIISSISLFSFSFLSKKNYKKTLILRSGFLNRPRIITSLDIFFLPRNFSSKARLSLRVENKKTLSRLRMTGHGDACNKKRDERAIYREHTEKIKFHCQPLYSLNTGVLLMVREPRLSWFVS